MKSMTIFVLAAMLAFAPAAVFAKSMDSDISLMATDKKGDTKTKGKPKGGGGC